MRRIKKATVRFLSLCKRGMNQMPIAYKAEDGTATFQTLTKALPGFDEQGELLAVGWPANYRDGEGDIADTVQVVKGMAHSFMLNGAALDIQHDGKTIDKSRAYVAESFIVQKGDTRFADFKDYNQKPVDVTDSWAVLIKIEDPALRALYKSEGWNGVSFSGPVELEHEDNNILKKLMQFFRSQPTGDDDLKPEELAPILTANNNALVTALKEALKPGTPPVVEKTEAQKAAEAEAAKPKPPVFKGNPANKADVKKHIEALKAFRLQENVDWSDPKAVENYCKSLDKPAEKSEDEEENEEEEVEKDELEESEEDTDQVKALKRQLKKLQKSSDAPAGGDKKTNAPRPGIMSQVATKAERDSLASGERMARFLNGPDKS